jgi:zinc transporter ZupT
VAFLILYLVDHMFHHLGGCSKRSIAGTLLGAAAVHSFLDGWSIRVLSPDPLASIAAPIGLGLHKIPEGLALGLVSRSAFSSRSRAAIAAAGVELITLLGAFIEPIGDRFGVARFGTWWTAGVLSAVSGSFLFLSFHTVEPNRKRHGIFGLFVASLAAVAIAALIHSRLQIL